jgi:hypothetical protein
LNVKEIAMRLVRPILGAIIGGLVVILSELVVAGIQKLPLFNYLSSPLGIIILIVVVVIGLGVGARLALPNQSVSSPATVQNPRNASVTRAKVRRGSDLATKGKGIEVDKVVVDDDSSITIDTQ